MKGARSRVAAALTLIGALILIAPAEAQGGGKPDKPYIEGLIHMIWPGLHSSELSRFDGNQVHLEHGRDVRMLPGILRYTQNTPLPFYDRRSAWDVITEFWTRDVADLKFAFSTEGKRSASHPWIAKFAGGAAVGAKAWRPQGGGGLIVKDHVFVDGHEWGYKWVGFMRRKPGISKAQADAYMRDVYAPGVARMPGVRRYVLGLGYVPPGADSYWARPPEWDAVDMIWFDKLEDMERFLASMDYQDNVLRPAEQSVIDQSRTIGFAVEPYTPVPFPPRYQGPAWNEANR